MRRCSIGGEGSDDFYFVSPIMLNHHIVLPRLRKVTIAVVYTWPGGAISLWPVPYRRGNPHRLLEIGAHGVRAEPGRNGCR